MSHHDFHDPVADRMVELVIDETPAGEHGVARCMQLWRAGATYEGGA